MPSRMRSISAAKKPQERKKSIRFGIPIFPGLPQASSLLNIPISGALPKSSIRRERSLNSIPSALQSLNVSDTEESEMESPNLVNHKSTV